jgi:hypothetical protein
MGLAPPPHFSLYKQNFQRLPLLLIGLPLAKMKITVDISTVIFISVHIPATVHYGLVFICPGSLQLPGYSSYARVGLHLPGQSSVARVYILCMMSDWLYAASSNFFFLHTNLRPKKHFAGTAYRSGGPGSIRIATGHMGGDDKPDIKDRHTGHIGHTGQLRRGKRALRQDGIRGHTGYQKGTEGTEAKTGSGGHTGH